MSQSSFADSLTTPPIDNFYATLSSRLNTDSQLRSLTINQLKNSLRLAEQSIPIISTSTDSGTIKNWVSSLGELARTIKIIEKASISSNSSSMLTSVRSSFTNWNELKSIILNGINNRISTGLTLDTFLQYWSESYRALPISSGGMGMSAFTYDLEWDAAVTGIAQLYIDFPIDLSTTLQTQVRNRLRTELDFYVRVTSCRASFPGVVTPSDCNLVTNYATTFYVTSFAQNHGFNIHIAGLRMLEALVYKDGPDSLTSSALTISKYALSQTALTLSPDGSPIEAVSFGYYLGDLGVSALLPALETLKYLDPSFPDYVNTPSSGAIPNYILCALYPDQVSSANFSDAEGSLTYINALVPKPSFLRYLAQKYRRSDLLWLLSELERRIPSRFNANITSGDLIYHDVSIVPQTDISDSFKYCYFPNRGLVFSRQNLSSDSTMVAFEAGHPLGQWLQQLYSGITCVNNSSCKANPGHASAQTGIFEIFSKGKVLAVVPPYTTDKRTEHYPGTSVALWNGSTYVENPSLLQTSRPNETLWDSDIRSRNWAYIYRYMTNNGDASVIESSQHCMYGNPTVGYSQCNAISDIVTSQCIATGGCSEVHYDHTTAETAKSYISGTGLQSYRHIFAYLRELDCVLRSESLTFDSSIPFIDAQTGVPSRKTLSRITTIIPDPSLASTAEQSGNLYVVKSIGGGIIVGDLTIGDGAYQITQKSLPVMTDTQPGVRRPTSLEAIPRMTRLEFLRELPVTTSKVSFLHLLCPTQDNSLTGMRVQQERINQDSQVITIQRGDVRTKLLVDTQSDEIKPIAWVGISTEPSPTATPTPTEPLLKWKKILKGLKSKRGTLISGRGEITEALDITQLQIVYKSHIGKKNIAHSTVLKYERPNNSVITFTVKLRLPHRINKASFEIRALSGVTAITLWQGRTKPRS